MCGICGIVHPTQTNNILNFTRRIAHRGPDDNGVFEDKNLAFGFMRLAIQDLSPNGHQPMISSDGRYVLIFNGEIYNHWDIRASLKDKYTFKSTSDTETILYGFAEYGTELFDQLNGIFALAIFDTHTRTLTLARDPFGIKPLYYYHKDDTLLFGSEIKSFLDFPSLDKTIDYKAIANYIRFLWSPGERTPFQYVKKLLPGYFMTLQVDDASRLRFEKYYEIPFTGTYSTKTEAELIEELDEKLFQAVKSQLLSDVPVGFFLSGGLDSSAIVAMAQRAQPNQKLQCYTIDSGGQMDSEGFSDDLHYAHKVAAHLDVDLKVVKGHIDILKDFDNMVYHLDEPQADVAPLHVLNICKQARADGFIVLLGGTGGDDLFSGYRRHQALSYEPYFRMMPPLSIKWLKRLFHKIKTDNPRVRRLKKVIRELNKTPVDRLVGYFSWISKPTTQCLLAEAHRSEVEGYDSLDILKNALDNIPNETSDLNKMLYLEMKYFLCDHNLNYTDKLSMATGIEVRVPFLDKALVEFSTQIPPHLKMKGTTTKYLLKKVMEKYLPHEVIYRPKAGFGAPVRDWVSGALAERIKTTFSKEQIEKRGIFDYETVHMIIEKTKSKKIDGSYSILSLLSLDSWFDQFTKII